jgi:hypothetical protein
VLVDGWHRPPVIMMGAHAAVLRALFERAGYEKAKDLLAYWLEGREPPPRLKRAYDRCARWHAHPLAGHAPLR